MASRRSAATLLVVLALSATAGCAGRAEQGATSAPAATVVASPVESASPVGSASTVTTPEAAAVGTATASPGRASSSLPAGAKKFATATLPADVGGYHGQVSVQDGTANGMYTGASEDQMVMATLSPSLDHATSIARLAQPRTIGVSTCGTADGVVSCFAPLDGGVLWLQGTDLTRPAELAALSNQLYDSFA